jgi:hypothetical protein
MTFSALTRPDHWQEPFGRHFPVVPEIPIQAMIRDLVLRRSRIPPLVLPDEGTWGTELLTPTSFLPWCDDAPQRRTFDLIRRLIEIWCPSVPCNRRHEWRQGTVPETAS